MPSIKILGSIIYKKYFHIFKNRRQLNKLGKLEDSTVKNVLIALNSVMNNKLSKGCINWSRRIEAIREDLKNNTETIITVEDYGAGSHNIKEEIGETSECLILKESIAVACKPSTNKRHATFLFELISEFKPQICLELGTCVGISTSYIAGALKELKQGEVFTIEGAPEVAKIAKNTFMKLGIDNITGKIGTFQEVLPDLLPKLKKIDLAFIDGHHNETATINYYKQITPYLSEKSIIIFDDIRWSRGMQNAWKSIINNKNINFSIDLWSWGICILDKTQNQKSNFRIMFD